MLTQLYSLPVVNNFIEYPSDNIITDGGFKFGFFISNLIYSIKSLLNFYRNHFL